jgi:hypothetical protein
MHLKNWRKITAFVALGAIFVAAPPLWAAEPVVMTTSQLDEVTAGGITDRWPSVIDHEEGAANDALGLTDIARETVVGLLLSAINAAREAAREARRLPSFGLIPGREDSGFFYSHAYSYSYGEPN